MKQYSQLLKIQPYPFQREGIRFTKEHEYVLIGDDMGLGKTIQGLAVAFEQINNHKKKVFVVCPSYLKRNWAHEVEKFSDFDVKVHILDKVKDYRTFPDADMYIGSYNQLKHSGAVFNACDVILADEAHYLKSASAKRTEIFDTMVRTHTPSYLILLTGTPLRNQIYDFYTLLKLLSYAPRASNGIRVSSLYKNVFHFCDTFCYKKQITLNSGRSFTKYFGIKNIDKLKVLLEQKYIRRKSEEVLDLPPIIEKDIYVDYMKDTKGLEDIWTEFQTTNKITGHISTAKRDLAISKSKFTANYATKLIEEGYRPALIYSDHPDACHAIDSEMIHTGKVVSGKTPMEERDHIVQLFQDKTIDYVVASIRAFNEGINLTASHNIIFNDLNWTSAENHQAIKRIHRIGQQEKSIIHYILGSKMDAVIANALKQKDYLMKVLNAN